MRSGSARNHALVDSPHYVPFILMYVTQKRSSRKARIKVSSAAGASGGPTRRQSVDHLSTDLMAFHCAISSQSPHAISPAPAIREMRRPSGTTFSKRTNTVRPAIQTIFITPPTKSSAISAQQQPTQ